MKINPSNSVQNNPYRKQVEKLENVQSTRRQDKIEISKEAIQMQKGSRIETEREEKINSLKDQIKTGQYHVDAKAVASKFYDFWN
ncbi:flagellar biosynthesis anti-sigma factor FlgM [Bacillus alkalicellulosilyticus]|uniref:flagellar biosynthesis anti-sigma factor FlgM n=1 Tax=Alkalihalobacterium alkalicellulosilyticum TaxID=1912214 RepID=UPI000998265F|nr:flagellar biosynthesis anti-sigma factor FlgM [Bacillus alkalicellulosilyticus]